jgi:hypothetical protein
MDVSQERLALDAWIEALRRAGSKSPELYSHLLYRARERIRMKAALATLSRNSPDYFLAFLRQADRLECEEQISQLMEAEPRLKSFSDAQKKELFAVWFQRGDHASLFRQLVANPEWREVAWRWLAMIYAERKDHEGACRVAGESSPVPTIPKTSDTTPMAELQRSFRFRPDDFQIGLQLFTAQRAAGESDDALATLQALLALPGAPSYLTFIEAEFRGERKEWEQAWAAWLRFLAREYR